VLDGAHNTEGVAALVEQLKLERDVTVLAAILADKDREAMISSLQTVADVYETTFDFPRTRTKDSLIADGARYVDWQEWLASWLEAPQSETLVVTGSLYFISEVRMYLKETFTND